MVQRRKVAPKRKDLPSSPEAEKAVLGSILTRPDAYDQVADVVIEGDFFDLGHAAIFQAIEEVHSVGIIPDYVTVIDHLARIDQLQMVGGYDYVMQLASSVPDDQSVEEYARIVRRHGTMRRMLDLAEDMAKDAFSSENEVEVIGRYVDSLDKLRSFQDRMTYEHWNRTAMRYWESIDVAQESGVMTGYVELDMLIHGLPRGEITVLGARSSVGKTALALNIAHRVAGMGGRVFINSLEMSRDKLMKRALSLESGVLHESFMTRKFTPEERLRIDQAIESSAYKAIFIDDEEGLTTADIERRMIRQKSDLLIIDYLGFVRAMGEGSDRNRVQALDNITMELKRIAKRLNIAVLVLSQLSRDVDKRPDHRPVLSDLRESGGIEQNAGVVLLLYRDKIYDPETEFPNVAELEVAKDRDGRRGTIRLWVKDELMKYESMVRESDVPTPPLEIEQLGMAY